MAFLVDERGKNWVCGMEEQREGEMDEMQWEILRAID